MINRDLIKNRFLDTVKSLDNKQIENELQICRTLYSGLQQLYAVRVFLDGDLRFTVGADSSFIKGYIEGLEAIHNKYIYVERHDIDCKGEKGIQ